MNTSGCPEEHELLVLASEGTADAAVRAHLEGCPDCRERLARLNAELATLRRMQLDPTSGLPVPAPAGPPSVIGKYLVVGVLGKGGQAEVYRAVHPVIGVEVVIKLAREPARTDRSMLAAEGKVLAELSHPGLARVYDFDFHENRPFLVMDYIPASDLRQYAARHRLTPREAAGLMAKVARALAVAHRRGVVHQDLKPDNILVTEDGSPRVIDFGIARLVHAWADPREQPDGGTAAFMAPEQARGELNRVDRRSDLFALGGVLYFLLTGQRPFQGATVGERLGRARRCGFDREALAGAPRRLRAICLRAMAARPEDRYGRAEELAAQLERFASRPGRRAVLIGVGCAVLLGAVGVAWWQLGKDRGESPAPPAGIGPRPPPLPENPVSLRLARNGEFRDLPTPSRLADVVPLKSGDELQIHARVPDGLSASLFWVDSRGKLRHLADGQPGRLLSYPPGAGQFAPLEGEGGTELLLVCWRRSGPATAEELERLWPAGQPWPALGRESVLRLDREAVSIVQKSRSLGDPRSRSDPEGEVRQRLEGLRLALWDQFDHIAGIAFTYQK